MNRRLIGFVVLIPVVLVGVLYWSAALVGVLRYPSDFSRFLVSYFLVGLIPGWISLFLLSLSLYRMFKKRTRSMFMRFSTISSVLVFSVWLGLTLLAFSAF